MITPLARGPDGFYAAYADADVFEVWADVARRYRLDPAWTVTTGYSMGAIGSFRLADAVPGPVREGPADGGIAEKHATCSRSLRNIPVLMWNASADELVRPRSTCRPRRSWTGSATATSSTSSHRPSTSRSPSTTSTRLRPSSSAPRGDRNPAHVTYVVDPASTSPNSAIVADHAYWVSNMKTRGPTHGQIDAISKGFGQTDPAPQPTQNGAGALPGGSLFNPYPYTSTKKVWGPGGSAPRQNVLVIDADNISSGTINVRRARVGCNVKLEVTTDGPLTLRLVGGKAKKKNAAKKGRAAAKKKKRGKGCSRIAKFG